AASISSKVRTSLAYHTPDNAPLLNWKPKTSRIYKDGGGVLANDVSIRYDDICDRVFWLRLSVAEKKWGKMVDHFGRFVDDRIPVGATGLAVLGGGRGSGPRDFSGAMSGLVASRQRSG